MVEQWRLRVHRGEGFVAWCGVGPMVGRNGFCREPNGVVEVGHGQGNGMAGHVVAAHRCWEDDPYKTRWTER